MFKDFIEFIEDAVMGISPDTLLIIAAAILFVNLVVGHLITVNSQLARNKKGFKAYNHEIDRSGLSTRENFYNLDAIVNKHETVITEAWSACYPDTIQTFAQYASQVNNIMIVQTNNLRRNFIYMLAFAFVVLCIPVLAGMAWVNFMLPALVVVISFIIASYFEFIDLKNRKRLVREYNLFLVLVLRGVHNAYGIRFKQCTGFGGTLAGVAETRAQSQLVSHSANENRQKEQAAEKAQTSVAVVEKLNENDKAAEKEKSERIDRTEKTEKSRKVALADTRSSVRTEVRAEERAEDQEMQERIAALAVAAREKTKKEKAEKRESESKNAKIKKEKITVEKKDKEKVKAERLAAKEIKAELKAEKKAEKKAEIITTKHSREPEQTVTVTRTVEVKPESVSVQQTISSQSSSSMIEQSDSSSSSTQSKMNQLSARLAALRGGEQVISEKASGSRTEQVTTVERVETVQTMQSIETVNSENVSSSSVSQSANATYTNTERFKSTSPKMLERTQKTSGKYDEDEVKEALAGLFGAMKTQNQNDNRDDE